MRGHTVARSEEFYEGDRDVVLSEAGRGETMQAVLARRWSRRAVIQGTGLAAATVSGLREAAAQEATPVATPGTDGSAVGVLGFEPIALDLGDDIVVAAGHTVVPLLKWGDPIFADATDLDLASQSAATQERQFGYNCDWI